MAELRRRQRRALTAAAVANGAFLVVEVVAGVTFGSLALLADAAHMLSDVAALGIALAGQRLLDRPATGRHSFGLQRAEVLAAQANGIILLVASAWIVLEAVDRLGQPHAVAGLGLLVVAALGLVVNAVNAGFLHRVRGESLNLRGAVVHLVADGLGSVGAMLAGAAVLLWGATWADPVASLLIAALVVWSAWRLLRETTHVLLEGTPRRIDAEDVTATLVSHPEVEAVHHLHVWSLASDVPSLSAHVVITRDLGLHAAQLLGDDLKDTLRARFGIEHATLELECHVCIPEEEDFAPTERRLVPNLGARLAGPDRPWLRCGLACVALLRGARRALPDDDLSSPSRTPR